MPCFVLLLILLVTSTRNVMCVFRASFLCCCCLLLMIILLGASDPDLNDRCMPSSCHHPMRPLTQDRLCANLSGGAPMPQVSRTARASRAERPRPPSASTAQVWPLTQVRPWARGEGPRSNMAPMSTENVSCGRRRPRMPLGHKTRRPTTETTELSSHHHNMLLLLLLLLRLA